MFYKKELSLIALLLNKKMKNLPCNFFKQKIGFVEIKSSSSKVFIQLEKNKKKKKELVQIMF